MAKHQRLKQRARGIAAIEFFLVLPIFLLLLALPLYFGRYCYHYSVAHAAATNAAAYMSKIPLGEIMNSVRAPIVVGVAREIAMEMTDELNPGPARPLIVIDCVQNNCAGNSRPNFVRVSIEMTVEDIFFRDRTQLSLPIYVSITLPYRGR